MKKLTRAEYELMILCWTKEEFTVRDIFQEALKSKDRKYETIKTTIERITLKGYLTRRKIGPTWLYNPLVTKVDYLKQTIATLIGDFFDGKSLGLVHYMIDNEKISREDLEALKEMLDKKAKKSR